MLSAAQPAARAIVLRDYQLSTIARLHMRTSGRTLVVAPTGAGKGTMAAELLRLSAMARGKRALFVVHRREIVLDITERLRALGVRASPSVHSDAPVRVISVQRALKLEILPIDLLVLDEAHHYAADAWSAVIAGCKPRRVVGFTATPTRADGRPLSDVFDEVIESVSYDTLISRGIIVPCRVLRPRVELDSELAQAPAAAYARYAKGARALIFVRSVDEAQDVSAELAQTGVRSAVLTAKTPQKLRDETLAQLERGELDAIANVGILTEGFDAPHVACIILARPCLHESLYLQIVGRVLRAAPGKFEATLIDLVGASHRHGLPGQTREVDVPPSKQKRDVVPRGPLEEPRGYVEPMEVIGMELEEVRWSADELRQPVPADGEPTLIKRREGRQTRATMPVVSANKFAPKFAVPAPAISPGFVYSDRGFWSLRWREHGVIKRIGLATKVEEIAREYLAVFRDHGPEALRERVRHARRRGLSLYLHRGRYVMKVWDDDRVRLTKIQLYTQVPDEASAVKAAYQLGQRDEAKRLIAGYKQRAIEGGMRSYE